MENSEKVGYLEEASGRKSAMRLVTFIGNLIIVPIMMVTWMIVCLKNSSISSFGWGEVFLILAMNAPKTLQKFAEIIGPIKLGGQK